MVIKFIIEVAEVNILIYSLFYKQRDGLIIFLGIFRITSDILLDNIYKVLANSNSLVLKAPNYILGNSELSFIYLNSNPVIIIKFLILGVCLVKVLALSSILGIS